ncbi:hypothetical protein GCM10009756_10790 [Pseudokineococcus marinus]
MTRAARGAAGRRTPRAARRGRSPASGGAGASVAPRCDARRPGAARGAPEEPWDGCGPDGGASPAGHVLGSGDPGTCARAVGLRRRPGAAALGAEAGATVPREEAP